MGLGNRMASRPRLGRAVTLAATVGVIVALANGCSHAPQSQQPTSPPTGSKQLTIWLTGYSWQDNTPPGSSIVGEPVLHQLAAGTGRFTDPITVAVPGHAGDMDWAPGTKFYLPTVRRYVIVEDSGAAKAPSGADTHLDIWIDGRDGTKQTSDDCASDFNGYVPAQLNPPDNLPVRPGPVHAGGTCNIPAQPDNRAPTTAATVTNPMTKATTAPKAAMAAAMGTNTKTAVQTLRSWRTVLENRTRCLRAVEMTARE